MSEEFGFQYRIRKSLAVEIQQAGIFPVALFMYEGGQHFLSRAGLAEYQYVRFACRSSLCHHQHLSVLRILALQHISASDLFFEHAVFHRRSPHIPYLSHFDQKLLRIASLRDIRICAVFHRLDCLFYSAECSQYQHLCIVFALLDVFQKLEAVHHRHVQIRYHDVETALFEYVECLFPVEARLHYIPVVFQDHLQDLTVILFIIHYKYSQILLDHCDLHPLTFP